ncbi:PAS domain S-box protein [Natrarchaeobius halalkaliphilus]|uniref:histidine kinase n=1 Tax=Natrarchaeobius halalkaliphilus TaxID=1679091 RepID=A0A3N6P4K3_9EURY|nr:PAS domain S-box protein [Natrarchaeobius halalkaliphilus]RQG90325.1 PAS domain S-box protein [Natrarchaeobius halalkaliphilus]
MSRPRILCVSFDRSIRASITLSLTDAPVDVVIAHRPSDAITRLEEEAGTETSGNRSIDCVLIDGTTVESVPAIVEAVESETPGIPVFVYWETPDGGGASSDAVLTEAVSPIDGADASPRLVDVLTARIESRRTSGPDRHEHGIDGEPDGPPPVSESPESALRPAIGSERSDDDLEDVVDSVRRQLVDVRSPLTVERVLRESLTELDRFPFVWIGEYDRGEHEIVPWLAGSDDREWPLRRTFAIGDDVHPLLERVIRSRTLQVSQPIAHDPGEVPFGGRGTEQGIHAVAATPLATNDELYAVLVVYSVDPITDAEREAIRSVGRTASSVLDTIAVHGRLEQRERALQRYEQLVETAGDGMYVFDDQGHIMTVNDALVGMTGYSREGLLGEHASILIDDASVDAGLSTIRSLLENEDGKTTETVELTLETKDGATIPCEAQLAIIVRDETFLGSVGVVRDVTERKRRERELRERNERLDAFARIVSHDLRNPLSVSQGYVDIIDETESTEYVEHVRSGLDRMESIIEDVLAIARDGEWAAETDPVDLDAVAREAWDNVSTEQATLSIAETDTVEADRSRLLRLLENLFRNATEHATPGSGPEPTLDVRVGSLETGDKRSRGFFVEDDGSGIPTEVRETLFDPSVSSSPDGLGIGLWIVREVATGHGWSVAARESENGGARFEFRFDRD